jgi:hypothetical protein
MASARTFYKTVIRVVVLSEEPYRLGDLYNVHYDITDGGCSGEFEITDYAEVDGPTIAWLLEKQGSEPGYFGLTTTGEDSDE